MHAIQNRHHEACHFASNVHVLIYALGETDALLIPMVDVRKPRLHAVACVIHCGIDLSEGSHTLYFVVTKEAARLGQQSPAPRA